MSLEEEYSFESLLTSAPASVALMGQTVLMTMMGTDASLLFNSYDGHLANDAEGALKIFQWATSMRSDVVHLVLCGCRSIELGEKYADEAIKARRQNQSLATYSTIISESHQLVKSALRRAVDHSNEILIQITSFLNRYPRKPSINSSNTPAGSVYTTMELMRQAVVRAQKAYEQLIQTWVKYGRLFSHLMQPQGELTNSIDLLDTYMRISRDYITPAANSVRALLSTVFDADVSTNENAAAAVEKARDELMAAYNCACQTIKGLKL